MSFNYRRSQGNGCRGDEPMKVAVPAHVKTQSIGMEFENADY